MTIEIAMGCVAAFALLGLGVLFAALGSESSPHTFPAVQADPAYCVCGFRGERGSKEFQDHLAKCQKHKV